MHSTIVLTLATVAAAVTTVSASVNGCNPSYNVTSSGTCFTNCNVQAGSAYVSGWTMDPDSPLFIQSLSIMCNKGTSEYLAFMTKAGICMVNCPDDPTLFNTEFAGACAWYTEHKNDTCVIASTNTSSTSSSSSSSSVSNSNATSGASMSVSHFSSVGVAVLLASVGYLAL
ncbi:uncharacterized protein B0P05DRAFT_591311 [Gilbertella persicaria]|uniref:uncharacterized protein n=1 Tax=Gilbertella persicaria TaxID=101096 RepID=UPI0022211EDD|nr:uncharacterized protein B0P05DRAFT_591311 [Gilbertella persicaria]KAI8056516.1 hypothetical protein B0P05DRAFT_591311 [Gilbertella persicaria]